MSRILAVLALVLSLVAIGMSSWALLEMHDEDRVITARGLFIKDANGQARVVLGAPVPDPVVKGETFSRIAPAAGLLLIGPDGNERGGYLTTDFGGEAVLTLDSEDGSQEVFKVVANPDAGASLFLMHRNGAKAWMTTYLGEPMFQLVDPDGGIRFDPVENASENASE